ncbi:MAG: hypothetical protein C0478_05990 [Planctomyces sp.]|nr:hypothetical protein [Planctomyces sp.]
MGGKPVVRTGLPPTQGKDAKSVIVEASSKGTSERFRPAWRWGLVGLPWILLLTLLIGWGQNRVPADPHRLITPIAPPASRGSIATSSHNSASGPFTESLSTPQLSVATFNIHRGKGGATSATMADFLQLLQGSDLVALQEDVPIGGKTFSRRLGSARGDWAAELPTEFQWFSPNGGNGLLLPHNPESVITLPLPGTRGKAFRQMAMVRVLCGTAPVTVVATHLDSSVDRPLQIPVLTELWRSLAPPCVLMGDLNTRPDDPLIKPLLAVEGTRDVLLDMGERTGAPSVAHIDWILTRGLQTVSAELIPTPVSDHPVIRATLELPQTAIEP